jgi:subtilase family serine protease
LKSLSLRLASAALVTALAGCAGTGTSSLPVNSLGQQSPSQQSLQPGLAQRSVEQMQASNNGEFTQSCPQVLRGDDARCFALFNNAQSGTILKAGLEVRTPDKKELPSGYGPTQLQSAYKLPSSTKGAGQTIAIVDAYDDPEAEADLGVYRSTYGLPSCTTANGCFKKVNQKGVQGSYPRKNGGWAEEISLDVDMVSANCPNCHIILVEATTASNANLATAEDQAVSLGANVVSNSYGGSESGASNAAYNHPGHIITASAGDSGTGPAQPCSYATVVCVGGTSLSTANNSRGWTETAWADSGSGCSKYVSKPSWQTDTGCTKRSESDTSAVADPNTGVAVYDSYAYEGYSGWLVFGGTSVSSPLIASVYGLAGNASSLTAAQSIWQNGGTSNLNDVTSGSNGSCSIHYICNAGVGYDGPTGWGTPSGIGAY